MKMPITDLKVMSYKDWLKDGCSNKTSGFAEYNIQEMGTWPATENTCYCSYNDQLSEG